MEYVIGIDMHGNHFINLSRFMLKKTFFEGVFDTEIIIAIGNSEELSKLIEQEVEEAFGAWYDTDNTIVINMDRISDSMLFMETLTHELLHAIGTKLRTRDIDHTTLTEEVYCFLYDFYFGQIWKWLEKQWIVTMNLSILNEKK